MIKIALAVWDKFGFVGGCAVMGISGVFEMAPDLLAYFHVSVPIHLAQGAGKVALAVAFAALARAAAKSEAEKRIGNPNLPNSSIVPAIQTQIDKIEADKKQ